jgi:uncharacterized protein YbjT (DUF2867 family)
VRSGRISDPAGPLPRRAGPVPGATGNVGSHIVTGLLATGADVRATSRNPSTAGLPDGVDCVPATQGAHMFTGVHAVFLNPATLHGDTAEVFLRAAVSAGVRRIVLLSSSSVLDDHPANYTGIHHRDLEQRIAATGLEWTFLRAGMFAANTRQWASQISTGGSVRAAHGQARIAPLHERDLAAAAVRALTSDDLLGTAPIPTGPELVTPAEQVRLIGRAIGASIRFEEVDPRTARDLMIARGLPPRIAGSLLRYYERALSQPILPTPVPTDFDEDSPRSYDRWIRDHAAEFRSIRAVAPQCGPGSGS